MVKMTRRSTDPWKVSPGVGEMGWEMTDDEYHKDILAPLPAKGISDESAKHEAKK